MNILILDAYHNPEITADTHLENDLIEALLADGNHIDIICPIPSRGITKDVRKEYKKKRNERTSNGQLCIKRYWAPIEKRNTLLRFIRYSWCCLCEYFIAKRYDYVDVVYSISTPPIQGVPMIFLKKKFQKKNKKISFVYYVEDIFPESMVAAKLIEKNSIMWKIGRYIENKTYCYTNQIMVLSDQAKQNLVNKNVPYGKINIIPTWIDTINTCFVPREKNRIVKKYSLPQDFFYVVYAGNLGEAQNINIILDAAIKLQHINIIKFIIFGTGGKEKEIKEFIKNKQIENVMFFPLQPLDYISDVYSIGDINIITCKKGFGQSAIPSKTFTIMAVSRPIIASYDIESDLSTIINDSKAGDICDAEDVNSFVNLILNYYAFEKNKLDEIGKNGRNYVEKNRAKEIVLAKMINILSKKEF